MKHKFINFINSGATFQSKDKKKYKINFINFILLFTIVLYVVFVPINLSMGKFFIAYVEMGLIALLLMVVIYLRKTLDYERTAYVILIFPLINYIATLNNDGNLYQTGFYWFFFYPIFAMLLKGNKKGAIWVIALLLIILGYFFYVTTNSIEIPYNPNVLIILIFAIILETALVMYYEKVRKIFDDIIIKQNKQLHIYKGKLEDKVVEQEHELIEIQKDIIFTMGSIGESRSKETANHVKRVAGYSKLFAELLGFSKDEVLMIHQASPMHDIGKVGIPDNILNKPARLTDDEFEHMKRHSQLGYNMLKNSNRTLLEMAALIAYEHHEKYDGTGYPNGLSGKDINIYGRITAIADVFDALGTQRVYKKSWDDDKVFAYLLEQKGKHFDPELIDIFFDNLDKFLLIRETYKD